VRKVATADLGIRLPAARLSSPKSGRQGFRPAAARWGAGPFALNRARVVRAACGSKQEMHCATRTYGFQVGRGTFRCVPARSASFRNFPFRSVLFRLLPGVARAERRGCAGAKPGARRRQGEAPRLCRGEAWCRAGSAECEVRSEKCGVRGAKCGFGNSDFGRRRQGRQAGPFAFQRVRGACPA